MRQSAVFAIVLWFSCGTCLASERLEEGRRIYELSCAECHAQGRDGAPVTGSPGDWKNRSPLWDAVLTGHAEKGYLGMPAKGGDAGLDAYQVRAATEYILTTTFPDLPQDSD